jgi:DNA-binding NarL/FixJ family response regulator
VPVHVAVVDPLPMFQQGVTAVLTAAGYPVEEPADLLGWARRVPVGVVLLTLAAEGDWGLLGRLHDAWPRTAVIALVEGADAGPGVRAVRAGARSVVPRRVTAAALRRAVEATADGNAVLPAAVAAALAGNGSDGPAGPSEPSVQQLSWLGRLATGTTVAQLAGDAGYSERAMYRLLQSLYQQLGTTNRMQAIMRARDLGWLSPSGNHARR